jgi:hypothetical protein
MAKQNIDYRQHFHVDQQINATFRLENNSFVEANAIVTSLEGSSLMLELIGNGLPAEPGLHKHADVQVTGWSGWALNRCAAMIVSITNNKQICIKLSGPITEEQRREYFRLDVEMPVIWSIPGDQQLGIVETFWETERELLLSLPPPIMMEHKESFKVVRWKGKKEILPQKLNLSGGGIRLKMPDYIEPGTLVTVDLFLPLFPPRDIHIVAEVLRCNEITLQWQKGDSFITAMCFHCISEKDRESIISFIFSEQRRLLQLSQDRIIS